MEINPLGEIVEMEKHKYGYSVQRRKIVGYAQRGKTLFGLVEIGKIQVKKLKQILDTLENVGSQLYLLKTAEELENGN